MGPVTVALNIKLYDQLIYFLILHNLHIHLNILNIHRRKITNNFKPLIIHDI